MCIILNHNETPLTLFFTHTHQLVIQPATLWWMQRELEEMKKYKPQGKKK
jgi:hypothetical protein